MVDKERFAFLDGLRGIAALVVVVIHTFAIFGIGEGTLPNASLAVDFFFCLSGFVVSHAYDERLKTGMSVREFMIRRMIRLYPMILLGVVIGAVSQYLVGVPWPKAQLNLVSGLAIFPIGLVQGGLAFPANLPMWSLFFEIAACLAYGVAAKRIPARFWLPFTALTGVALSGAILWRGEVAHFGLAGGLGFAIGFLRVAYPFALGVLFSRLALWRRFPAAPPLVGAAAILAILLGPWTGPVLQILAVTALMPAVVLLGAKVEVRSRFWDLLGRLSYPVYLMHYPTHRLVHLLLPQTVSPGVAACISVVVAVAVSWPVLIFYDEPLRNRLQAWRAARGKSKPKEGAKPATVGPRSPGG